VLKKLIKIFLCCFLVFTFSCVYACADKKEEQEDTSIIQSSVFSINEEKLTAYTEVDNDEEDFLFSGKFQTKNGYNWKLFLDKEGLIEIETNKVNLVVGNNLYYLLVYIQDEPNSKILYDVTIRRLPIYTVKFVDYNKSGVLLTTYKEIQIQENDNLQIDKYGLGVPTKEGYTFKKWSLENNKKIKEDTIVQAMWTANKYKITLDHNGGTSSIDYIYATYGETLTIPVPQKPSSLPSYYSFKGYTYDSGKYTYTMFNSSGQYVYNSPDAKAMPFMISKDITVKALWGKI